MEKHGLVSRQRSVIDRRRVYVHLTDHAKTVLTNSPMPLQEHFTERFNQLKDWEQNQVIASLQRVVQMMDASDIVAAPLLTPGIIYDPIDSMGAMPDANKTINSP